MPLTASKAKRTWGDCLLSTQKAVPRPDPRRQPNVTFLFLDGSKELIMERMRARQGHFMKENMVNSQFETLERPDGEPQTLIIPIDCSVQEVVSCAIQALQEQEGL